MNVTVVTYTYNERETIKKVVEILEESVKNLEDTYSILVVDSLSPDGTGEIVKELCQIYPNLHLLSRPKSGIGKDCMAGMAYAMRNLAPDVLVEMDADLQHDPKDVRRLIGEIHNGLDCVIGSRYIPGGAIPKEWGWPRKFLSASGSLLARFMLGTPAVHDMTSGFKATRVKGFLDQLDFGKILSGKQAYKLHILFELFARGAKFKEVPIVFANRQFGESKIMRSDLLEALKVVTILGIKKRMRFFKFLAVGFFGLIVQTIAYEIMLLSFYLYAPFAVVISSELAIISNFTFNNLWTFRSMQIKLSAVPFKFLQFNLTSLGAPAIQFLVVGLGVTLFGRSFLVSNLFFFLSLALVVCWNYFFYTHLIWARKE